MNCNLDVAPIKALHLFQKHKMFQVEDTYNNTIWHHNPEDLGLKHYCCKSLKTCNKEMVYVMPH